MMPRYFFLLAGMFLSLQASFAQGGETFSNHILSGSAYSSGSYVGDNGLAWEYEQARNPSASYQISGQSIGFSTSGTGYVKTSATGGIWELNFNLRSYFTSGTASERSVQVWINGVETGEFTLSQMDQVEDFTLSNIAVSGLFTLEFRSVGTKQIVLDDISWLGYDGGSVSQFSYVWTGNMGDDFQNPSNWSPERNSATTWDTLIFDGVISDVSNISPQEIASLQLENGSEIKLSGDGGLSVNQSMTVDATSILTIYDDQAFELSLLSGANASVSGKVVFDGPSDEPHRLLAEDSASVNFEDGAVFQGENFSGNPFGDSGSENTVVFKSGSQYISKDGGNPFGLTAPNSKVYFEEGSWYIHQQNSQPSFGGRIYSHFAFDYDGTVNVLFGSSNQGEIDSLVIAQGTLKITTATNQKALDLEVGDLLVENGATFNFSPSRASSFTGENSIAGTGSLLFSDSVTFKLDAGPDGLFLEGNLSVAKLEFVSGVLNTNGHVLEITNPDSSALIGFGENSYVVGELKRAVDVQSTYVFPVGSSDFYNPVSIEMTDLVGVNDLSASFNQTNLGAINPAIEAEGKEVTEFLDYGYWAVEPDQQPTSGIYNVIVTSRGHSNWNVGNSGRMLKRADVVSSWEVLGNAGEITSTSSEVTTSLKGLTSFSHFAIALGSPIVLPVELLDFSVEEKDGGLQLNWLTVSEYRNEGYILQKSFDGVEFQEVTFVLANDSLSYQWLEEDLPNEVVYYRLIQRDTNGTLEVLGDISFQPTESQLMVFPNPVFDGKVNIKVGTNHAGESLYCSITDMSGRLFWSGDLEVNEGGTASFLMDVPQGMYLLEVEFEGEQKVFPIVFP